MLNNNEAFYVYSYLMDVRKKWLTHEKGYRAYKTQRFLNWEPDNTPVEWREPWANCFEWGHREPTQLTGTAIYFKIGQMNTLISDRKRWKTITNKNMPLFRKRMGV